MAQKPNDKFACIVSVMLKYEHILTSNWYKRGFHEKTRMGFKRFI